MRSFRQTMLTVSLLAASAVASAQMGEPGFAIQSEAESIAVPRTEDYSVGAMIDGNDSAEEIGVGESAGKLPFTRALTDALCGCETPLFESTGSWLRRGFWYTEVDAVVMSRFWQRNTLLMGGDPNALVSRGSFGRALTLHGTDPGAEGSVRFTLGRFLFRDSKNRDHQLEFNSFGGGEYIDDATVESLTPNNLFVAQKFSSGNPSFDQSSGMAIEYGSRFNSFELNYRVRGRMRRDTLELDPTGTWRRKARPQITKHFLVGLRWFDLSEDLDWTATDVLLNGNNEQGSYKINTSNDLFGVQFGGGIVLERSRWSLDNGGKAGVYVNSIHATTAYSVTNDPTTAFDSNADEFGMSFIGEYSMVGRWHIRPNLSLRAGWQMLYVTSVALAPFQADFAPMGGQLTDTGDPFYHGALFGIEGYW